MADMTFAEHVNIVANLDNSLSMSASLNRSAVALKVGSTYDVVSVLSVHNRTTNQTEHTTISGTMASDTIGAYLSLLESTIEAAYPIAVTTSITSTVSQVATMNTIGVELTLSGSAYYVRALNMKVSLAGIEQYNIDAELVNPLELTPKMLELTPDVLLAIDTITGNIATIDAVSSNIADVNTVADNIVNLNTVASIQNLANMTTVANDLNAMDLNGIADVTVVANNLILGANSSINRVSASIDNVNTVMSNITNIDAVAAIDGSVTAVALIDDSVVSVAGKIAAIETANANATNINTVSGSIDNVNSVATTIVPNIAEILEADTNAATATTKASEALASANAADASELLAEKWASEVVDTVVLNGKYSSYHWATKASENVAPALSHAARTDNPHAVTAAQVGLGNVSNTAQVTAVSGTAPIVSSGGTTPAISISAATTADPGSMSAADKTKLDGIETNANNYVLPTSVVHDNESGALHATDALRVSGATLSLYKGDGTFESVTTQDTIYVHPVTDGNLHVPATSTTNNGKVLTAGATAGSLSWVTPAATDLTVTAGTTAGPTLNSSTGADVVVPSASGTESGVVTTGDQTFAGVKTLTSPVLVTPSIGVATGTSFNSITGLATVAPVAPAVTAAVGTSTLTARQDHVHPTNFTATAADIKINGAQSVGTLDTFPRADHVHPTDTSRAAAATTVSKDSDTGVAYLPAGTTAQRPTLASNVRAIRYNVDLSSFEGWGGTSWGSLGGGATGGGTDNVFNENEYVVTTNYTIPAGKSAVTVGDASGNVTINAGVTVTLDSNSRWVVL